MNILSYTTEYLIKKWNLSKDNVLNIQRREADKVTCDIECSALDLYEQMIQKVFTPLPSLNKILNGGLQSGTITELVGPPGSGKSQLCMTFVADHLNSLDQSSIFYIDTNGNFSMNRLFQILKKNLTIPADKDTNKMLSKLYFFEPTDKDNFYAIFTDLREYLQAFKPKLLIIDCMAYYIRTISDLVERTRMSTKIISILKKTAIEFNITVLLTNQITGVNSNFYLENAALGNSWSHYINTRIYLDMNCPGNLYSENSIKRQARIVKSSFAFNFAVPFKIDVNGVHEI